MLRSDRASAGNDGVGRAESRPSRIGPINLDVKQMGERNAGCVKKTSNRHAVREMKEGPSGGGLKPPRAASAKSCGSERRGKGVAVITPGMDERDERKRTFADASKGFRRHQNRGCPHPPGRAWRRPAYWPSGVRCIEGVNLIQALARNLRTCLAMPREKAQAANP